MRLIRKARRRHRRAGWRRRRGPVVSVCPHTSRRRNGRDPRKRRCDERQAHFLGRRLHLVPRPAEVRGPGKAGTGGRPRAQDAVWDVCRAKYFFTDPDDGIGAWTVKDFADAVLHGVSPEGEHYYPAFPYSSYTRMRPQDVADLHAFMKTLPRWREKRRVIKLGFPFNVRRGSACGSSLPERRAGCHA